MKMGAKEREKKAEWMEEKRRVRNSFFSHFSLFPFLPILPFCPHDGGKKAMLGPWWFCGRRGKGSWKGKGKNQNNNKKRSSLYLEKLGDCWYWYQEDDD